MPKELNIEKLERKFTTLTKSKESIQAVSSWIMHHHEFCDEIVEQWYIALTKDQNALVMFYVANEIIQNCGKKRVPQYREAFSKVLEKAVCLEKVKEIKSEVCRLLSLWKERSIFDDDLIPKLEAKLNGSEVIPPPSSEEDEDSELEIIAKYKSENLFDSLKNLMAVETKTKEKKDILSLADEPLLPDFSHVTVRDECLEMLKKLDSFSSLIKDCLKATNEEIKARENALKELKYSCIFYTAQHGDVKKVANAYMTYGKRLKIMERKLSEKISVLPSPVDNNSPFFSENNTRASPIVSTFTFDHDTSSVSRSSSKMSPTSCSEKSRDAIFSAENLKNSTTFWGKISQKASLDFPKSSEKKSEETVLKISEHSPRHKFSKLAELYAETKSDSEKQVRPESASLDSLTGIPNPKCSSSPPQENERNFTLQSAADQKTDLPKNIEPSSTENSPNQETIEMLDNLTEETLNEKEKKSSAENDYEVDQLLEESYDTKKAKSNVSVKRKIELLLQSKGKKVCTDASKGKNYDGTFSSETSAELPVLEGDKSLEDTINKDNMKRSNLGNSEISQIDGKRCTDSKVTVPIISPSHKKVEKIPSEGISVLENVKSGIKRNLTLDEKIQNVSNIFDPCNAIEQCKEIDFLNERSDTQDSLSNNNTTSVEDYAKNSASIVSEININSESSQAPENDNISFKNPASFFDSSLFSSLSSLSTDFLKNILGKNKTSPSQSAEDSCKSDRSPVKDSTETRKLLKNKDSENSIKNLDFSFLGSVSPNEDKFGPSNILTKPLSQSETTESVTKNKINIKEEINTKGAASTDNTSIKLNDSEQPTTLKKEIPFSVEPEKILLDDSEKKIHSPISDAQLNPKCQLETDKAEDKPNLLLTLQNVLECIANKNLSAGDSKNVWNTTPMSFENCLTMYHALNSTDVKYANVSIPPSTQNVVLSKTTSESTITSGIYSQDNLEVMDMECDSE